MLALDFDGVLCDSARESFLVASTAFRDLWTDEEICRRLPDVGPGHLSPPAPDDSTFAAFLEMMPLGNRAEDYAVVLSAICRDRVLEDQAAYDRLKAEHERSELETFHRRYYEVRARFRDADPEGWLGLLRPFPGIGTVLDKLSASQELAIATARDRASVDRILEHHRLGSLFDGDRILDKETGVSKTAHLTELSRRTKLPFGSITLVDDKLNHLQDVAELGVRCALAGWGYNGPREHRAARAAGFRVLGSLDELAG